ncbi:hypothetical protein BCR42DRAFT_426433 [Absidia repens]|uniref:F-box domain-containing protein n=1 Tax=Absidia repens TaxID=90262 RepID=A0A1X2I1H0_9FUNG|nr:hypothetical protein BCR42DRAFT_426433 [Absidia repens]
MSSSVGHYIRHLDLGEMMWSDSMVGLLTQHVHGLKAFYIRNGECMTDLSFCSSLPRIATNLTTLHLEQCYITQNAISAIGQHCHPLKNLALINCKPSSPPPPAAIVLSPPFLMHARVEQFTLDASKTDAVHIAWMEASAAALLAGLPWLTHLTVFGHPGFSGVLNRLLLTATTATATASSRWPHLTHLTLGYDNSLDDAPLIAFVHAHPHLIDVRLCHLGDNITDATLDVMAVVLPDTLTHLVVTHTHGLTAPRLRHLIGACPLLAFVSIEACGLFWYDFPELFLAGCRRRVDDTIVDRCGPFLFMEQLGPKSLQWIRRAPPIALDNTKSNNSSRRSTRSSRRGGGGRGRGSGRGHIG